MYDVAEEFPQAPQNVAGEADFQRGAWVEVRSATEIAATLDADGCLDGLPFMPEMARLCGRRLKVLKRADKTCVEGFGLRRMRDTVFLDESRCDGAAHESCARNCLMFWKEAWLKPASLAPAPPSDADPTVGLPPLRTREGDRFICQSTALAAATAPVSKFAMDHLITDLRRGDITRGRLAHIIARTAANVALRLIGLSPINFLKGPGAERSRGGLNLKPGDWVRVKSAAEIRATLDAEGKNLGLAFEPEMVRYAGGVHQVEFLVSRMIHEETGRMVKLQRTVALRGLSCIGLCVRNCPRANTLYWREIWLERADPPTALAN